MHTLIISRNNSDPYLIAEEVANNSTRALDLWGTVNDSLWFKTDNIGDVLPSEVSLNFDLNKSGNARSTGSNYVFNVRTVKDISPTSSIIRIRAKSFGFRQFCVRQRRRLSNR